MRNYLLLPFMLVLISCSSDTPELFPTDTSITNQQPYDKPIGYPKNEANMYDINGQLYYRLTQAHLDGNYDPTFMDNIVSNIENISNLDNDFLLVKPMDYISIDSSQMQYRYTHPITAAQALDSLSITSDARLRLIAFTDSLAVFRTQDKEFNLIYNYIHNYETDIIGNTSLNAFDKEVMLTISSIARYGFFFASTHKKRKPRDKNWDLTMTGIISGIEGAGESGAKAVTMSVVMGIAFNRDY